MTRLITESDLELKVGDTFCQRLGMGYGPDWTVMKIEVVPGAGIKVFYTTFDHYFWYQDLMKVTEELTTQRLLKRLEAPNLEIEVKCNHIYIREGINLSQPWSWINNYCPECGVALVQLPSSPDQKIATGTMADRQIMNGQTNRWDNKYNCPRGIFERGNKVYWDTAKTVLSPKSYRRYETVSHVVKDVHDGSMAVAFDHGGWQPIQKVHHIWEEIDE